MYRIMAIGGVIIFIIALANHPAAIDDAVKFVQDIFGAIKST